ncbi:MAG: glycosyltransferase family 39 protein, partial [Gammaproteobacteria bacterium]|nr:glycosyltransferase family 39 protein [Gammaproteobacteria bacterium]
MSLPDKRTAFGASEIALIGLIVLGATLRLWDIGGKAIWLDEAYSIWIANHSLWQGVRLVAQVDFNPPLYYVFLSLWQSVFGDGQVAVRILSALFSTAAIPFLFSFTRRICDDKLVALVAVLLLVFSSFQVHYAQETRMYSLLVLVAAMAMFFAVGCLDDLHERRLAWRDWLRPRSWRQPGTGMAVGLSVSQTAIMLTHNTATVFFPLALNGTVFGIWLYQRISNRPTSMRAISSPWFLGNWIRIQAVTLLLWLPWAIPFALQGMRADQDFWLDAPSISTFITTINNFNFAHIPQWIHTRAVFLLYAGLVLLGILNWRRRLAWVMLMLAFMSLPRL